MNSNIKNIGRSDLAIRMFGIVKESVQAFIDDEALTRGAAIAFYTATSLAPVLLIVIAIAGLVFGHDAAQNAISGQLSELMGDQTAELLQTAVASASKKPSRTASACGRRNGCDLSSWWKGAADGFLVACTPQKNMVHGLLRT